MRQGRSFGYQVDFFYHAIPPRVTYTISISGLKTLPSFLFTGAALVCALLFPHSASAADSPDSLLLPGLRHSYSVSMAAKDTSLNLPHQFITPSSDSIWINSELLQRGADYDIDYRRGNIVFRKTFGSDSLTPANILATYEALPFNFRPRYYHRRPVYRSDSASPGAERITERAVPFSTDDLFGRGFQRSGTFLRGLSVGTNRDFSLSSGFRLQMSGNLTDDIKVIAALTDENTPIQPEGTTQRLQEIDKVFIEILGRNMSATMGDFHLNTSQGEFGKWNRKLQGAKGSARFRSKQFGGDATVAAASAKGKFATNTIAGIEGVQGPYRLTGLNGERDIIVVAGTERVFMNGEAMSRGETNDYTIDYATAEIYFTPRRLVTGSSRIAMDFEYSDRQYHRNFLSAGSSVGILSDRVKFTAAVARESDDRDSPIDVSYSDSDLALLSESGDDRSVASKNAVELVGPGKGQYLGIDTLIVSGTDTSAVRIYRYSPQDSLNAVYSVRFTSVGFDRGDYRRISAGHFEFVGIGKGSYLPLTYLPLPQAHAVTDIGAEISILEGLTFDAEYAASHRDANTFSDKEDGDNGGAAFRFGIVGKREHLRFGNVPIGSVELSLKHRLVGPRFVPLDRVNEVEFDRRWNIGRAGDQNELLQEGTLVYRPNRTLSIISGIGRVARGEDISSAKYSLASSLADSGLPNIDYRFELVRSEDAPNRTSGRWIRQGGETSYGWGLFTPGVRVGHEDRSEKEGLADSLRGESFQFTEIAPRISVNERGTLSLAGELSWREEDSVIAGTLRPAATSVTQKYMGSFRTTGGLTSTLDVTIRKQRSTSYPDRPAATPLNTVLVRSLSRYLPQGRSVEAELSYEAASERSAKLERYFQNVQRGAGNYRYRGDVNNNGIADAEDFELTRFDGDYIIVLYPSESLVPVTNVKAGTRLRLNGQRLFTKTSSIPTFLNALSAESSFRVSEKSTSPDTRSIYTLSLDRFLDPDHTIEGSKLFSQDLHILENERDFSLRLRFQQRSNLSQLATVSESGFSRERAVRIRMQLVDEVANQTEYVERRDALSSDRPSGRIRSVKSSTISTDWTYRPLQLIEVGFRFGVGEATNFDSTKADLNDQSVRLVYSFREKGQGRMELTREEVRFTGAALSIPFELTGGKPGGSSWLWSVDFDYRLTEFIQATVGYDGRAESSRPVAHYGKMEVRAFF